MQKEAHISMTDRIQNDSPNLTLKNISSITKKEDFVLNNDIQNSLFPSENREFNKQDISLKNNDIISSEISYLYETELSQSIHNVCCL
jgi:hypothetical protein